MVLPISYAPQEQSIGGSFGTGLSQGLQNLINMKMQDVQRQKQAQGLQQLLNLNPQIAQGLTLQDPRVQEQYIKQKMLEPQNQAYAAALGQILNPQSTQPASPMAGEASTQSVVGPLAIPGGLSERQSTELAKIGLQAREAREKQELSKTKLQSQINKDIRTFSEPYQKARSASEKDIADYNNLIRIAPQLRAGSKQQILEKLGLGDFYRPYSNELAQKLTARLSQNVSGVFGSNSRITNYLEQVFQRSLPTLWNTPDGIIAISKLNKLSAEANIVKDDARKQILKGMKPGEPLSADVVDRINEQTRSKIEDLEKQALDVVSGNQRESYDDLNQAIKQAKAQGAKRIRDTKTGNIINVETGKVEKKEQLQPREEAQEQNAATPADLLTNILGFQGEV